MKNATIFFPSNIKFLRERKGLSQEDLALSLDIKRIKLHALESGRTKNPAIEDIVNFAAYFKISIDSLLKVDLTKLGELKLRELEAGNDVYLSGGRIRVLSISVSSDNKENIEFVPVKAKAGYLAGYADPEFIGQLPKLSLPHLPENKSFRMFATEGDSMLPIPENCLVLTEYVSDWNLLKQTYCIVIMKSEQRFLFKQVTLLPETRAFLLHSLNPLYPDVEVFVGDVLEVWRYHSHLTDVIPSSDTVMQEILKTVKEVQVEVKQLRH